MIRKIEVEIQIPEKTHVRYLGNILHGVLMEYLPTEMAEFLHNSSSYSPLKQRIYHINDKLIWEIVSFNEQLSLQLMTVFNENQTFYLRQYQKDLKVVSYKIENIDMQGFVEQYLSTDNPSKFITLKIQTPMSYKTNNTYAIFPDIYNFFRSIMLQFDNFFSEYQMYDKETLSFMKNNIRIVDYRLKSTRYYLEKVKIPSFMGEFTLRVEGPEPFLKLIHFLIAFGELSGSGIKTSIGMGKYLVHHRS
ncbi:CRISPR-associated endoribonuclease Cas6 [Staphylococcus chromogenes]|uniref:CRISPR-associated endoribonuclease Cas6 n=1 Tax=Staphylococcus chromogenes TaxID=46126 RepID=UPI002886D677|nr:CRISPR-associated endoribonuclease Cas6 [Staphylococcus chromogenes]MDT0740580.1 CRISPR-associated endoribonuclease Cas6 [Staphylococcus chromogenes]